MIQHFVGRFKDPFDLSKVHDPTGVRIKVATQMQFNAERVPVQSRTLVSVRYVWETMRGLNREDLKNVHAVLSHAQASKHSLADFTIGAMGFRIASMIVVAGGAFGMINIAHAQERTVYRCIKDNTVSISTFKEPKAKCEPRVIKDTAGKPENIFGELGVVHGNLYEGTHNNQPALTTRKTPGFTLLTRFTVVTPKASPAHEGLGTVGKARVDMFNREFKAAAKQHKVDEALLRAIAHAESGFAPTVVSPKGAQGVMQLMPATAAELGVTNAFDATQSINGGARYLRQLMRIFRGDLTKVIAAYNAGPGAVNKYRGVPPYRETVAYLDKVNALLLNYQTALGVAKKPLPILKAAQ